MSVASPETGTPVALVTGAGRGIGAMLARHLAQAGWDVVAHYFRSHAGAECTAAAVQELGRRAWTCAADLSHDNEARRMAAEIQHQAGRLDVLINNSGVYHQTAMEELSENQWAEELGSTAAAVFFTTRACLPLLRRSPCGRIINIGDSSCDRPGARDLAIAYHIGKTGVFMLTRSFAQTEARHGVTVNLVSPGLLDNSVGLPADAGCIPARRFGTADDLWTAISALLRPEAGYLTGSHILASGGWNLR